MLKERSSCLRVGTKKREATTLGHRQGSGNQRKRAEAEKEDDGGWGLKLMS